MAHALHSDCYKNWQWTLSEQWRKTNWLGLSGNSSYMDTVVNNVILQIGCSSTSDQVSQRWWLARPVSCVIAICTKLQDWSLSPATIWVRTFPTRLVQQWCCDERCEAQIRTSSSQLCICQMIFFFLESKRKYQNYTILLILLLFCRLLLFSKK